MIIKYLLYAGIIGFSCWMISEIIEIAVGYNAAVFYLTSAYHFWAGIGIWGLHKAQSAQTNNLSKIGAFISLIAYLGLTYFPIQVMNSGLSFSEFMDANPLYKIPGGIWFIGMILFGISVLKTRYFPTWTPVVFILGTIVFTVTPLLGWPTKLVNITNITFSMTVIYMCLFGLGDMKKR